MSEKPKGEKEPAQKSTKIEAGDEVVRVRPEMPRASDSDAPMLNLLRTPSFEIPDVADVIKMNTLTWLPQGVIWPLYAAGGNLVITPGSGSLSIDPDTAARTRKLEEEINELRKQRDSHAEALGAAKNSAKETEEELKKIRATNEQLLKKEQLSALLDRVNTQAQTLLLDSTAFQEKFLQPMVWNAYVISVDIRRSTELMLKARSPQLYAEFITRLTITMMEIVKNYYGIFDKFTGDGILAVFPEFFSGPDAGYLTITAAAKCHEIFNETYRDSRKCFNSILRDVGLGIGIDYGPVSTVRMAGGITVVGAPVVYACRLAGGPAGKTLLNQPAYEAIISKFSKNVFIQEMEIEIKHEGSTLAYEVCLNGSVLQPSKPSWESAADQSG